MENSKEKQISDMQNLLWCRVRFLDSDESVQIAEALYNAGYRKSTDLAEEIFAELLNEIDKAIDFTADSRRIRFELCQQKDIDPYKDRFFNVCDGKYNCVLGFGKYIAELKKKYTQGIDSIVGIEWHCEEGWKPTDTLKLSGDEKFVDENGEEHGYSEWYKESEDTE